MAVARTLMVQGTSSGVGKSLLTAALCRIFTREGLAVRPFKAQNMALNAAVTVDGGEIGRAQALQALACRVPATRDMNPILLKPESDSRAQVILHGDAVDRMSAAEYHRHKRSLWPEVAASLDRLRASCDLMVIEGAGSPAEVNLRDRDIVNMRVARHAEAPVLLVGDIDRGGVFAALLGTLALLRPLERRHVRAMVVNNFRGDAALFSDGVEFLQRRARLPVLGVVPHLDGLRLPEEDSLALDRGFGSASGALDVAVIRLPRISNFDDCDALLREPGVHVRLVDHGDRLGDPDLVVLPGSKATRADLDAMRLRNLDRAVVAARERGSAVLGICGGFQLLGTSIADPEGSDAGSPGSCAGLGLLPTATVMAGSKTVRSTHGRVLPRPGLFALAAGAAVQGYEIHAGRTAPSQAPLRLGDNGDTHDDGATSDDGWVAGTHLHGLLDAAEVRRPLLRAVAARRGRDWTPGPPVPGVDEDLDRLADAVQADLDINLLRRIVAEGVQ